jgi:hypothetical protein
MTRSRDTFALFKVGYRNNAGEHSTALIWAHRISGAIAVLEEYAAQQPHRHLTDITNATQINSPDTDTEDYASIAWVGGQEPVWQ